MFQKRLDGHAIKAGRERLGLTERDLAKALPLGAEGPAVIADVEAGRVPCSPLLAFAIQSLFDGYRPAHLRAG